METKRIALMAMAILTFSGFGYARASAEKENNIQQTEKKKESEKMKVTELTADEFKDKVMDYEKNPTVWKFKGDKPAIIDFYATWCGPCKATAPVVEDIANEYAGKIDVYKVDVDQQEKLAALFGIQSIPTILFIPKEGVPKKSVGAMMKSQFEDVIRTELLKTE
ncbi:MAG: thioredoxin [Prevotella sp.]|jgi:thioredoxin|nr:MULTISPECIES: thioredoxin [unclassified Prevotella]MCH3969332.1 thioredoxin [Prevotella sp.]MCH3985327.1 thioredoxin [Prevotella sp.]MCH3991822.1 thioredoxin [Prevotella sp.]MCH4017617.1 thioredoxin [Prevotella sp.]MCH4185542.1 thioredoxin [Prevotella sp.]